MAHWQQEMFWRFLVLGLLVALLDGVAAASTNCTEGCRICADECLMCKKGYYKSYGECEECKPSCRRCFRDGMCYFDCTDGWYGLHCSRPCTCSYGICNKYSGTCRKKPDPPVLVSGNANDAEEDAEEDTEEDTEEDIEDDGLVDKIFIGLACIIVIFVTCIRCMPKNREPNEEQMDLDNTDIVPPSQKLLPGQVPITMRSTNMTYANSFAGNLSSYISGDCDGNSIMCPPRETNTAPPLWATYSGQQTDVALTHCTTNSRQDTDIATAPCATYGGQQTNVGPLPSATYGGHQTDIGSPPSTTYSGQQTGVAPSPSATYSGQETDVTPPPCTTYSGQQTDSAPPPSATYLQQTDIRPLPCALQHCTTNSRQETDIATAPCATYVGQQTNVGPLPSATYSGEQTDIAPPPPYTPSRQQADIAPPPSYESLFNSNREHS
ncbi:uncharacterized protein [Haliotis cracherodii]